MINYEQMVEIAMRENAMLKNSLNIYSAQSDKATHVVIGMSTALENAQRELTSLIEQLNLYTAATSKRLLVLEGLIAAKQKARKAPRTKSRKK